MAGRTRMKLAALLLEGFDIAIDANALGNQQGTDSGPEWDLARWFGWGRKEGKRVYVYSWDTMTECVRYGVDGREIDRAGWEFSALGKPRNDYVEFVVGHHAYDGIAYGSREHILCDAEGGHPAVGACLLLLPSDNFPRGVAVTVTGVDTRPLDDAVGTEEGWARAEEIWPGARERNPEVYRVTIRLGWEAEHLTGVEHPTPKE